MGTTMNKATFQNLIDEDLGWLSQQPHSLEKMHIESIVKAAPDMYYKNTSTRSPAGSTAQVSEREKTLELVLRGLCELKQHKNKFGKTELYLSMQPEAWCRAMKLVGL